MAQQGDLEATRRGDIAWTTAMVQRSFERRDETRVRVNSIHPGLIKTPMADSIYQAWADAGSFGTDDRQQIEGIMVQAHPLGRHGQVEDVATGVVFLAADDSGYMTGAELVIDGGFIAK